VTVYLYNLQNIVEMRSIE